MLKQHLDVVPVRADYSSDTSACPSEGIMQDVDDEVIGCFSNELDIGYEEEMSSRIEWLDDGHFITQDFLVDLNDGSRLQLPGDRPLRVHTFIRDQHDTSYQHPAHPFTALVHMLDAADENSDVFCSAPYLTDKHALDQLAHYAKPVVESGRNLSIHVILGPEPYNQKVLNDFVGDSIRKYWAVKRLKIRVFGHLETAELKPKIVHSKALVSTAGAMIGSYNYTYAARFRNREDAVVVGPGTIVDGIREDLFEVWNAAEELAVMHPHEKHDTSRPRKLPPGYKPPKGESTPKDGANGAKD